MNKKSLPPKLRLALKVVTFILAVGFIILGTLIIVYYSRGYRIDRHLGVLEKTGVLNIESDPFRATIFINDKEVGKTPKTISSLKEGRYEVRISKDGYVDWKTNVDIVSEKSTPIFPHLFLIEPESEDVFNIDNDIVSVVSPQYSNFIFITTRKDITLEKAIKDDANESSKEDASDQTAGEIDTTTPENPTDSDENIAIPNEDSEDVAKDTTNTDSESGMDHKYLYKIWRYDTNPSFWGASQNPKLIYEDDIVGDDAIDLKPSYNGEYILMTISTPELIEPLLAETTGDTNPSIAQPQYNFDKITLSNQLLDTNSSNEIPAELDISGFLNDDYTVSWSKDNEYLILESDNQIVSVDISSDTKYLLRKTSEDFVWTTDQEGKFYYLELVDETNDTPTHMKIHSSALTGSSHEVLVDRIYYADKPIYLVNEAELIAREDQYIFTNSPTNPQFAGKITRFEVENSIDSIVVETEFALYLYDLDTDKYILASSTPSTYLSLAPDIKSFIFTTPNSLNQHTFDKEEADHTSRLGSKIILNHIENVNTSSIQWHNSSRGLFYSDSNSVWSIDNHGENNFNIAPLSASTDFFLKDATGDYIFRVATDELPYHLERLKVN